MKRRQRSSFELLPWGCNNTSSFILYGSGCAVTTVQPVTPVTPRRISISDMSMRPPPLKVAHTNVTAVDGLSVVQNWGFFAGDHGSGFVVPVNVFYAVKAIRHVSAALRRQMEPAFHRLDECGSSVEIVEKDVQNAVCDTQRFLWYLQVPDAYSSSVTLHDLNKYATEVRARARTLIERLSDAHEVALVVESEQTAAGLLRLVDALHERTTELYSAHTHACRRAARIAQEEELARQKKEEADKRRKKKQEEHIAWERRVEAAQDRQSRSEGPLFQG
jgi:hypothetical protein